MTPFDWGGYLSWKFAPRVKVSLDGRYEVAYPIGLEEESYRFFTAQPGWEGVLGKYATDLVLIPRVLPLANVFSTSSGWTLVYEDSAFLLYGRPGLRLPLAAKHSTELARQSP
jgi:hypothetical protein